MLTTPFVPKRNISSRYSTSNRYATPKSIPSGIFGIPITRPIFDKFGSPISRSTKQLGLPVLYDKFSKPLNDKHSVFWFLDGIIKPKNNPPSITTIYHDKNNYKELVFDVNRELMNKTYVSNGQIHRDNAPAVIHYSSDKKVIREYYYQNNKLHREDGPAKIDYDYKNNKKIITRKEYYLKNRSLTADEFNNYLFRKTLKLI